KEIIFMIHGKGVFSKLKFENGTHRVQRVPETESGGRVHTSTATVAVLPEAEDVEVELHDNDIRIDRFASSGPGGQSVNTTMSAVRLTHEPTGIVVSCQDEKSQIKNKEKAMRVLRARLYDKYQQEAQEEYDESRKSAVGSGDRSERIRTYNFPQNRVTDHRITLTIQKLDQILEGKLDEFVDALLLDNMDKAMKQYEVLKWASSFLKTYNREENVATLLLQHHRKMERNVFFQEMQSIIPGDIVQLYKKDIEAHALKGIPIQHLIGY